MDSRQNAWENVANHAHRMQSQHLRDLFAEDHCRFSRFQAQGPHIFLDYSKNLITQETLELLMKLAEARELDKYREKMFSGEAINWTEDRAVLHTALRAAPFNNQTPHRDLINTELNRMLAFAEEVRSGQRKSASGETFTDVINIGIGGSDLGPAMVCEALRFYESGPKVHFVSNVDATHLMETLKKVRLSSTLFLVASKTFTTQETMTNAHSARKAVIAALGEAAIQHNFAAMSTNVAAVKAFGMNPENAFAFWDFVGGRYSLWSVIGLPIALQIGAAGFRSLLRGAYDMDQHFLNTPLKDNLPVLLGLIGVYYATFMGYASHAILPYDQYLHRFTAHFQQVDMESNGKTIDRDGKAVTYGTGPVIWGEPGTNGQHAFYQLIHQGTQKISCDFIGCLSPLHKTGEHHPILMSHLFAQAEALAFGLGRTQVEAELKAQGLSEDKIADLSPHKVFLGNRVSNMLLMPELNAESLGSLIALYEHKVFVQGIIWRVNSFDQWGVELGKKLAKTILEEFSSSDRVHDSSTAGLIQMYRDHQRKQGKQV